MENIIGLTADYITMLSAGLPFPFKLVNIMSNTKGYVLGNYGILHSGVIHCHDHYHINYILTGDVTIEFNGKQHLVQQGQAFILPPYITHSLYTKTGYTQIGIDLFSGGAESELLMLVKEKSNMDCVVTKNFAININYKDMSSLLKNPTRINTMLVRNIAEHIVLSAMKNISQDIYSGFLERFKLMVRQHDDFKLTLNDMCGILGYSRAHLERLAMKELGCSVMEYYNKIKLNRIIELLKTTDMPLSSIASATNFCDTSHLCVFFKKRTGLTPGAYRKTD